MRIFLIDTENVGTAGINCLNELDSSDLIVAFTNKSFSSSNTTVKFAFELKESAVQFKYLALDTRNISQYLDRVLGTALGQFLTQYSEATAVIISNDKGYLPEIEYWKGQNRNVTCCSSIEYFLHPERKPTAIAEIEVRDSNKIESLLQIVKKQPTKKETKAQKKKARQNNISDVLRNAGFPASKVSEYTTEIMCIGNKKKLKSFANQKLHIDDRTFKKLCTAKFN